MNNDQQFQEKQISKSIFKTYINSPFPSAMNFSYISLISLTIRYHISVQRNCIPYHSQHYLKNYHKTDLVTVHAE